MLSLSKHAVGVSEQHHQTLIMPCLACYLLPFLPFFLLFCLPFVALLGVLPAVLVSTDDPICSPAVPDGFVATGAKCGEFAIASAQLSALTIAALSSAPAPISPASSLHAAASCTVCVSC